MREVLLFQGKSFASARKRKISFKSRNQTNGYLLQVVFENIKLQKWYFAHHGLFVKFPFPLILIHFNFSVYIFSPFRQYAFQIRSNAKILIYQYIVFFSGSFSRTGWKPAYLPHPWEKRCYFEARLGNSRVNETHELM